MDTFPDIGRQPDWSASGSTEASVIELQLGDGYSQTAANGMNNCPEVWQLQWTKIPAADGATLHAFLKAMGGWQAFYWTPPPPFDTAPIVIKCKKYQRAPAERAPGYVNISATFEQKFNLG